MSQFIRKERAEDILKRTKRITQLEKNHFALAKRLIALIRTTDKGGPAVNAVEDYLDNCWARGYQSACIDIEARFDHGPIRN